MRRSILLAVSLLAALPSASLAGNTYLVDNTEDLPDIDPADGLCVSTNGHCTLRAAIMQANISPGADTITLPAGTYQLTRPGDEDAALTGDLDITESLTINGAGAGATIVDGNGAVTNDRVFQILPTALETSLSGMTIRNGQQSQSFGEGGGLFWQSGGSHAQLSGVVFEDNHASYGAGLFAEYSTFLGGTMELDAVVVHANTSTAAGGGLAVSISSPDAIGNFVMRGCHVYGNMGFQGGGIYLSGSLGPLPFTQMLIENSEIDSNTASHGAGLDNDAGTRATTTDPAYPVIVSGSRLHDNHSASLGGGIENNGVLSVMGTTLGANTAGTNGGGIFNNDRAVLDLAQSVLSGNTAQLGGGIYSELFIYSNGLVTLTNSTLSGNTASQDGGGVYVKGGTLQLMASTLNANIAGANGGGIFNNDGAVADVAQSTLSGNSAELGGGIYSELLTNSNGLVTLTNSTLSGNTASQDGGGVYVKGGTLQLFNATVASNRIVVPAQTSYAGMGGGVYVAATGAETMVDALLGDNTHRYGVDLPVPDDCFGFLHSNDNNLIETTSNCTISGESHFNVTGQDPKLGPLQFNGGPTKTQALLPDSPAIDAGTSNCEDAAFQPLLIDQRGAARPFGLRCDIGAFEAPEPPATLGTAASLSVLASLALRRRRAAWVARLRSLIPASSRALKSRSHRPAFRFKMMRRPAS